MKKSENYGVQEMDTQEIKEIKGGFFWPTISGGWFNWANLYDEEANRIY